MREEHREARRAVRDLIGPGRHPWDPASQVEEALFWDTARVHQSWVLGSWAAGHGLPVKRQLSIPRMEVLAPLGTARCHGPTHGL